MDMCALQIFIIIVIIIIKIYYYLFLISKKFMKVSYPRMTGFIFK